ncbi:hypothetical protein ACFXAW_21710 [Streptomyces sp. NPDC059445]|uniref:hypothetical protein n=1 Tax=Streptomyces sp. NPDC059445 TaxID=3346832 RepID=UPI0036C840FE
MPRSVADRARPLRRTSAMVGAVALTALALAAGPASADNTRPGLVLGLLKPVTGVKPGGSFELPGAFANKGTETLDKVWLTYDFSRGLTHQELPSNCERSGGEKPGAPAVPVDEEGLPGKYFVACEFDQEVKPGAVYAPEKPLSLDVLGHALYEHLAVTISDYDPVMSESGPVDDVPGTGPAVKLVELPSTTPLGGIGPAKNPAYDYAGVPVTAVNTADFQVAAQVTDRDRQFVTLEAKFTNAGPAWVMPDNGESGAVTHVLVKMPAGTTVTLKADGCTKVDAGSYSCVPSSYYWANENSTYTFPFHLRIVRAVVGAKGSVALEAKERPFDKNKKNDTAVFLLGTDGNGSTGGSGSTGGTGSTGGGSAGGTGSAGDSGSTSSTGGSSTAGSGTASTGGSGSVGGSVAAGSESSSGTGGGLANTGAGSTLPLAGVAAAALAAGAGTVVLTRRRAPRR